MFVTPGVVVDGQAGNQRSRSTSISDMRILLGSSFYDDWQNAETLCPAGSARQSGRQAASLESDHDSAAAEARLQRQVHLGDVAALV